ncbi:hypothetical protein MLD63_04425 [Paracoccus sp. TK19116]|uniref:Sulfotransferase family protein n=1 Tax=Paracoccus albicereus TaxID=2922394 RepID=A0ABT1MN12_9RHOB|nr:hypothetical protein [Paracoccus albicereus]MCQ0969673.1 hypothetical protein [Paracoccus albicereus]
MATGSSGQAGRRICIHLGVQKTGSTSIQRHLALNEAALADRLVLRLPVEGGPLRPLGRAAVAFSLSRDDASRAALAEAIAVVRENLPDGDLPVLLSHENLAGAMPGNGGETGLFPGLPDIIWMLEEGFSGLTVDYVVYSRRMGQWKPSVWAQAVRTDGYKGTWEAFQAETATLPGWQNLIRRIQAVAPGRVTHLRLEDEIDPAHPGALLLAHLGLNAGEIAALHPLDGRSMQRLPDATTEFIRRLNGLAMNPHARYKVAELAARVPQLFNPDYRPAAGEAAGRH